MLQSIRVRSGASRGKLGHRVNEKHFTGKRGGKPVRRRGHRGLTRKARRRIRGSHENKYGHLTAAQRPVSDGDASIGAEM